MLAASSTWRTLPASASVCHVRFISAAQLCSERSLLVLLFDGISNSFAFLLNADLKVVIVNSPEIECRKLLKLKALHCIKIKWESVYFGAAQTTTQSPPTATTV